MTLRVLSLFSGIGAFEKALTNLNIDYSIVGYSDINKFAIQAYQLIHKIDSELSLGDVTLINEKMLPDFDLMTYGFPCTSVSTIGRMEGIVEGKTASGLLYDALRIAKYKKPKYMIAENVENLIGKKFKGDFNNYLEILEDMGYRSYWRVINSVGYLPQNRNRIFIVSIRNDINKDFNFELRPPVDYTLREYLDSNVDDKYRVKDHQRVHMEKCKFVKNITPGDIPVYDFYNKTIKWDCANTITPHAARCDRSATNVIVDDIGARRFTPRECFRLMGFDDEDYQVLKDNKISDIQLYTLAGNSIVVDILEDVFKNLSLE